MIQSGLNKILPDSKDWSWEKRFGSVPAYELPDDFSVDAGLNMYDQYELGIPLGCTGCAQADLCQDEDDVAFSPKAIYDATLEMEGNAGNYNTGCDIRDSLKVICQKFGRGGYFNVQPTYDGIRSAIWLNQIENRAVSIGIPWFESLQVGGDGIVPDTFTGDPMKCSWHNAVVSGWKTINGKTYLLVKSWQGYRIGNQGWLLFSPAAINYLLSVPYTGAFTVKKNITTQDKLNIMQRIINLIKQEIALFSDSLKKKPQPA